MQHSSKKVSARLLRSSHAKVAHERSPVSHMNEPSLIPSLCSVLHWESADRWGEAHSSANPAEVGSLGWQYRGVGARTDSKEIVTGDEVIGGDWMLEFKSNHGNALHSSRLCRWPQSLGICALWKQSSGRRWGVGGSYLLTGFEVVKTKMEARLWRTNNESNWLGSW